MTVRPAEERDLPAILALTQGVGDEHAVLEPDYFRAGQPRLEGQALEALGSPQQLFLVAERDGVGLGYLRGKLERQGDRGFLAGVACLWISELAVAPAARRAGVGKALMAAAEAWAGQQGLDEVRLSVWLKNADAMAFYDRAGYRAASLTRIKRLR